MKFIEKIRLSAPVAVALSTFSVNARADAFSGLGAIYCQVFGKNSTLIAFVAAAAVLVFFVVLALNEGNSMMTWALKILIGIAGMVGAIGVLGTVFPGLAMGTMGTC